MSNARTLFTADHHFGHAGVIRMCQRPFASVEEMDALLIESWNTTVRPADHVYHLGDFALGASPERCAAIFKRLRGTKHLLVGNHDRSRVLDLPWASKRDLTQVTVNGTRLVLCHYAMRSWPGVWRGAIHLFGHTHGTLPPTRLSCDVGVDAWAYRPVTLSQILQRLAGVEEQPEEIARAKAVEVE